MPGYQGAEGERDWDALRRGFQRYRGEGESGRPEYEAEFFEALLGLAPEALEAGGGSLPEVPQDRFGEPDYYKWQQGIDPQVMSILEDYIKAQDAQARGEQMSGYLDEKSQLWSGTTGRGSRNSTPKNIERVWELFHPGRK